VYTRGNQYPHGYSQATHDHMTQHYTEEGLAQRRAPRDAAGNRIPRDQLHWFDRDGNPVPHPVTYDHEPSAAQHWNTNGRDSPRADRNDWHDDPAHLNPMTKGPNSSKGATSGDRFDQTTGPNYSYS
jgi:hypothetical protein